MLRGQVLDRQSHLGAVMLQQIARGCLAEHRRKIADNLLVQQLTFDFAEQRLEFPVEEAVG